jgi:hypothetical protein
LYFALLPGNGAEAGFGSDSGRRMRLDFLHKLRKRGQTSTVRGYSFSRPLVLLHSDGWGRVGVRDQEGFEQLRASGMRLGERPYDFYTLETADDVTILRDMLKRHRDSTGRAACLVMNFVMANLDFRKMLADGWERIHLLPLSEGLPGKWKRPGLIEAYRLGITQGVFYPALHGLTHFCRRAVEHALSERGERAELLQTLWKAETPYIYWRMPWVGYEYCNPEKPYPGFLSAETQTEMIREAADTFRKFLFTTPVSACAPGYRANRDTYVAWSRCGVRVAQNGGGAPRAPHIGECEILNLHRTIDFEPSQRELSIEKYMQLAEQCFARGIPAVISVDAINFHSALRDFRGPTLQVLDDFLSGLEAKYPNLLYVHDSDLYSITTRGRFKATHGSVSVEVKLQDAAQSFAYSQSIR